MHSNAPGHIAVVGGGTAGWLAALILRQSFVKQGGPVPRFSVIESPDIPTVGVGEGSTSVFRQILLDLNIDEAQFLRETGATFKFGILHCGWRADGRDYWGPIDDPNIGMPPPQGAASNWLHLGRIASGKPVADIHLYTWLMKGRKSAYKLRDRHGPLPISNFHHAYHFDQAKLGKFLSKHAQGIDHIRDEVSDVDRCAETGSIRSLALKSGQNLPVDFVVDCTGFRRAIIGKLDHAWHSYDGFMWLNKAIPFWTQHSETDDIAPFTTARALGAGWMWSIPTADRIGNGYVYSDAHISDEAAVDEVTKFLGHDIEINRVLSINPGRLDQAWVQNCVAIGLSQSFLEPLEATSIHGSIVQILLLAQELMQNGLENPSGKARARYNQTVAQQIDDFADFINLHYAGGRVDTPFWRDVQATGIKATTQERLDLWSREPIRRAHFPAFPNLPHVQEQLYTPVLDGLSLMAPTPSKNHMALNADLRKQARQSAERLRSDYRRAAGQATGHRAYLEALRA